MPNWSFIAIHGLYLLALALWIGGLAALTFIVAPLAFRTLPTRQAAGQLVGAALARLDALILALIPALIATSAAKLAWYESLVPPVAARYLLLCGAALCFGLSAGALSPKIRQLRDALGPIDEVPESDPRRQRFRRLHGLSMLLGLGQLLCLVAALFLS